MRVTVAGAPESACCVAGGSRVRVSTGSRCVEELKLGDEVECVDPETGERRAARLCGIRSSWHECLSLTVGAATLRSASDHPLHDPNTKTWAPGRCAALVHVPEDAGAPLERVSVAVGLAVVLDEEFGLTVGHPLHNSVTEGELAHDGRESSAQTQAQILTPACAAAAESPKPPRRGPPRSTCAPDRARGAGGSLRWVAVLAAAVLGAQGCRCGAPLVAEPPPSLSVSPASLSLTTTYVGLSVTGTVSVSNGGGRTEALPVSVDAPFTVEVAEVTLGKGAEEAVVVRYSPLTAGRASGTLRIGPLEVPVEAEALEVPACMPSSVCVDARFDVATAQCVEARRPEGASCETRCVTGGCTNGACIGRLKGCDDGDACTLDACDEAGGCSHPPVTCPAPGVCQLAVCRKATGCAMEEAPDGTLCGVDDCLATQVDVCLSGACVRRQRPDSGRCANRWVPTAIPGRGDHAMAFDAARQRVVLFGGYSLGDTWSWDGATWTQRTPAASPPARYGHAMAYDAVRQRVVLFGGADTGDGRRLSDTWEWDGATWTKRMPVTSPQARDSLAMAYDAARQRVVLFGGAGLGDTWEWDGTTWTQRTPVTSPPARSGHAMAYDAARRRVVLFGGAGTGLLSDTWEWDGAAWTQRAPVTSPSARGDHDMVYDALRQRVVLFGGAGASGERADTWEWDGTTWVQRTPLTSPPARRWHAMAFDAVRQRVVSFGGAAASAGLLSDTWEWDGANWTPRTPTASPPWRWTHAMTWDVARQRLVLFGGGSGGPILDTWEWDGASWTQRTATSSPSARFFHAMAFDAVRQRVVLFGGDDSYDALSDTWEWDAATWTQRSSGTTPGPRRWHAMTFDAVRQRTVLFGGDDGNHAFSDTWEWDGVTWTQRLPSTSPSMRSLHTLAFDAVRERVVLFGGLGASGALADTWEWDGATWTQRTPPRSPPARTQHAMAFDPFRQRVVLFGGLGLADTWEWDGASWTQRMPTTSPPMSQSHAMAYDAARQRVVLFDGTTLWYFLP